MALASAALGIMWRTWTKLQIRRLNHCVTFKDHCPTKTNSSKRLWYCANVHVFHIIVIVVVYIELYRPASDKIKFIIDILTCIIWSAHANAGALCDDSVNLFVCLSDGTFVCRLRNLLSHSLGGSTWRRAGAYRIDSDTLVIQTVHH